MKFRKKDLTIAVSTALLVGSSAFIPVWSQEDVPDTEVPELEGAEAVVETPENVARDADGYEYPEGGPGGLYRSIADKQAKSGETVKYDTEGNPTVTPGGGNHGHQVALEKQRRNMERKLDKEGIEYGAPEIEPEPLPDTDLAAAGEEPGDPGIEVPEQEGDLAEAEVQLPELTGEELSRLAHDADGDAYPEGGPKGLYGAIEDKQNKLNEKVEYVDVVESDGTETRTKQVTNDGSNSGLKNSLARLRENLERKLRKAGLFGEDGIPDTQPVDDVTTQTATLDSRSKGKSGKEDKVGTSSKPQKQERVASTDKSGRLDRADLFEAGIARGKPARVDKLQKPEKAQRVEKPQKPVKVQRVEKPQKPVKITRVERPTRPEKFAKPEKPSKPDKPGRPN